MRIVRRRVVRSAGASTIGKRTNLAAAIVLLQLGPLALCLLMSALPAQECSYPSYECSAAAIEILSAFGVIEVQL